jgi:choline kinase
LRTKIIYNPFYAASGPLVTLWIVLNKIDTADFMFMNGDTVYGAAVYNKIRELINFSKEGIFLFCSENRDFTSDDILVKFNKGLRVNKVGKDIKNADAVSAGLVIVKGKEDSKKFRDVLDKVSRTDDFLNYKKTWHSFLNDLVNEKIKIEPILINKNEWAEVDLHFDLKELQNMLKNKITF